MSASASPSVVYTAQCEQPPSTITAVVDGVDDPISAINVTASYQANGASGSVAMSSNGKTFSGTLPQLEFSEARIVSVTITVTATDDAGNSASAQAGVEWHSFCPSPEVR